MQDRHAHVHDKAVRLFRGYFGDVPLSTRAMTTQSLVCLLIALKRRKKKKKTQKIIRGGAFDKHFLGARVCGPTTRDLCRGVANQCVYVCVAAFAT